MVMEMVMVRMMVKKEGDQSSISSHQGPPGPQGLQGPPGPKVFKDLKEFRGDRGLQGPPGRQGIQGIHVVYLGKEDPEVSEALMVRHLLLNQVNLNLILISLP